MKGIICTHNATLPAPLRLTLKALLCVRSPYEVISGETHDKAFSVIAPELWSSPEAQASTT